MPSPCQKRGWKWQSPATTLEGRWSKEMKNDGSRGFKAGIPTDPEEPWLMLDIKGKPVKFLVNTRSGKPSHKICKIMTVLRKAQDQAFIEP